MALLAGASPGHSRFTLNRTREETPFEDENCGMGQLQKDKKTGVFEVPVRETT